MKHLLLPLITVLALPAAVYAHHYGEHILYGMQFNEHGGWLIDSEKENITQSEIEALDALCKIGLNADDGIWSNQDINAAIATIKWGQYWPDNAEALAYKTCNWGGYLD